MAMEKPQWLPTQHHGGHPWSIGPDAPRSAAARGGRGGLGLCARPHGAAADRVVRPGERTRAAEASGAPIAGAGVKGLRR